jgi:hypothetical protein
MPNFSDILDTPASEIARPKPLPQGTYLWMVKGLPRLDKSARKGTEFSEYTLQCLEASDDVDSDALKAALTKGSGEIIPLRDRSIRVTFYHTEDALFRLKKFLGDLGIDDSDEDDEPRTLKQMMQEVPGRQVWGHVKHTPSDDGESLYANIDKTAKVQD